MYYQCEPNCATGLLWGIACTWWILAGFLSVSLAKPTECTDVIDIFEVAWILVVHLSMLDWIACLTYSILVNTIAKHLRWFNKTMIMCSWWCIVLNCCTIMIPYKLSWLNLATIPVIFQQLVRKCAWDQGAVYAFCMWNLPLVLHLLLPCIALNQLTFHILNHAVLSRPKPYFLSHSTISSPVANQSGLCWCWKLCLSSLRDAL